MNRIISLFVTISLILCMPCFSVQASGSVSVTIENPLDGSTVENTAFEVELLATGNVSETVLEFDGKRMTDVTLTEGMLTLGEHTLTAYVIGDDGSVESATSTFYVVKSIDTVRISNDFSTVNSSAEYLNKESVDLNGGVTLMPKLSAHGSAVNAVAGSDGAGNIAINVTSSNSISKNKPFFKFAPQPTDYAIANCLKFSFDINVNAGTKAYFSFSDTDKITAYLDGSKGYLSSYCPVGTWCRVDVSLNILNDTADMTVSYYDDSGLVNDVVYTDKELTAADKNTTVDIGPINDIRINYEGSANCGLSLDNVLLTEEPAVFTGIKKTSYIYDSVESSDAYPNSKELDSIRLYMNEAVVVADLSDKFELTDANGTTIELSSVSASDDGLEVTVVPAQALTANTEYKLTAKVSASYLGDCLETDRAVVTFKTAADLYAMTGVNLKVGSTNLLTAAQLKGKKLTSDIHFSNSESDAQDICAVLAVRSGKKLVGLKIIKASVPAQTSDYVISLETDTIPNDITNAKIQIMFLDNMKTRKPVFATHEVNY